MSTEKATGRVRMFPSTQYRIRIKAAKQQKSMAQIIDEQDKFCTNIGSYPFKTDQFMKLMKKAVRPKSSTK